MPIHLTTNPYRGINAHLNSYLQAAFGGWLTFHNDHIAYLKAALNRILPPSYYAVTEQSLQVDTPSGESLGLTRPDIGILTPRPTPQPSPQIMPTPTLEVQTRQLLIVENELRAVVVYHQEDGLARLITRLELLSPTNKKAPTDYEVMRRRSLSYGVYMVELDYLHETPTLFDAVLPDYTRHDEDAYPFYISVTDPMPEGVTRFYCFQVDDPIPPVPIPLGQGDFVVLDVDAVYQQSFADDRRAHLELDYAHPPVHFDRYSSHDQARIHHVMARLTPPL